MRPPPQLVLLDVDFTLIRPRRVFDARGYAELGARFGARLDPERYEQARLDALHVFEVETLEHRSAQHRRFAVEIVRGMGAGAAEAEQIGIAAEQAWGDPSNFELFPDVVPLLEVLRASRLHGRARLQHRSRARGRSPRSSGSAWTSRSPRARTAAASPARRSSPPRSRSAARRPRLAVMVGDSLDDDIAGASSCGLRAVLVDRHGRYPDHAGERIGGLDELPPLLGLEARAATPPAGA